MTAKRKRILQTALAERDESAKPVINKVHKPGTLADPIRGLFEIVGAGCGRVVQYEPDRKLRDTEEVSLQHEGESRPFYIKRCSRMLQTRGTYHRA